MPMESSPTPTQNPLTPEERKNQIAQLQRELQSLPLNDKARPQNIRTLISLLREEEDFESGETAPPKESYRVGEGGDAFPDTVPELPPFVRTQ